MTIVTIMTVDDGYQHLPTSLRNGGLLGPNRFQLMTCEVGAGSKDLSPKLVMVLDRLLPVQTRQTGDWPHQLSQLHPSIHPPSSAADPPNTERRVPNPQNNHFCATSAPVLPCSSAHHFHPRNLCPSHGRPTRDTRPPPSHHSGLPRPAWGAPTPRGALGAVAGRRPDSWWTRIGDLAHG